ncbi:MAG: glycosyltransferase family 1 protein [Maritimibacter sp.]
MIIVKDNIIRNLQAYGGITYYWNSLYSAMSDVDVHDLNSTTSRFRYLPARYQETERHIFHSSYYRTPLNRMACTVTTVHDFVYELYVTGLRRHVNHFQKWNAIRNSAGVICISANTRNDLLRFLPIGKRVNVEVVHNGFNTLNVEPEELEAVQKRGRPFFLFLGGRSGYKNFDLAVDLVAGLKSESLVIVGGGPLTSAELKLLNDKLDGRYDYFSFSTDPQLKWLYQNCEALIYPSLYEGFGMPPLEAAYQGAPVFALDTPSSRELYADFFEVCPSTSVSRYMVEEMR